ncbi:MAG: hypothetical protein A3C88_00280 [Candidatus Yanofskybacteria bacterium RIFCSPHIGHO2_02_FULL_50_12]|uniref:Uncharacterized protein n=1 Tax=Candidatus Yanofskybacteria bacterium RIFCSPHIGHO2_02_FULL_50_12 TaxID=1802685 RepID=A0A1F8FUD9_9BACT|nr:MAG: hypothetical protein A3C88_00280 [Candidatus Yanofskybacteria bacterium RIFCSPHIGHO2_02_FULL_50_12]
MNNFLFITEEEVQEEFDRTQQEPYQKKKPNPEKIESDYTGDLSGDPDDTTPGEAIEEIEREERRHDSTEIP